MGRIARIVAPGYPHHITQRGNRRQETFFKQEDYRSYINLMSEWCGKLNVEIWSYCLMPNHIHLIAVPAREDSLRRAVGEAHRRYTRGINFREGWRGHLWQGRFSSFVMDEDYLIAAARYIELNPVRAGLCAEAGEYEWSSAAAHLRASDDKLVKVEPLLALVGDWKGFLSEEIVEKRADEIRSHEKTGRPLGSTDFIEKLEKQLGRVVHKMKPGPKRKEGKG